MGVDVNQRNVTRNSSTADYEQKKIFLFDNRYQKGIFKATGGAIDLAPGMLVVRNAGSFEVASVAFSATPLSATQTVILGGLTYTSTGATTQEQLAEAFANLLAGATTGAGTSTGTYSGTLTGYSTGANSEGVVVFTASTTGNKTNLAATGTGAAPTITITDGSTGIVNGYGPATSSNLDKVIGVVSGDSVVSLLEDATSNIFIGVKGTIDGKQLILPASITLNTVLTSGKTVKDILEGIGFHVDTSTTEHTQFDN